jgi:hydroxyacylglutathione hydrolase
MKVIIIPALKDNYIFLLVDKQTKNSIVIDPAESKPVLDYLNIHGLNLTHILNTHHHGDHIGGNAELKSQTGAKIVASSYDNHRIPGIDKIVTDNDEFILNGINFKVIYTPGHTLGHIVFYSSTFKALFCGDTLFSLGCGRLFEDTAAQMFNSLQKIKALPNDTAIYCAHEYSLNNARFATYIDPYNVALKEKLDNLTELRNNNQPTIPSILSAELACNPFLRTSNISIRQNLGLLNATELEVFTEIRLRKDNS